MRDRDAVGGRMELILDVLSAIEQRNPTALDALHLRHPPTPYAFTRKPAHLAIACQIGRLLDPAGPAATSLRPRLSVQLTLEKPEPTHQLFDDIARHRNQIEARVGHPMTWLRHGDDGKASTERCIIRSFVRANGPTAPVDLAEWGAREYLTLAGVFPDYLELDLG
jgi:hypothetical protein